jgi:hypothetical protein
MAILIKRKYGDRKAQNMRKDKLRGLEVMKKETEVTTELFNRTEKVSIFLLRVVL